MLSAGPRQTKPTSFPRSFQVESPSGIFPDGDAGRSSGLRAPRPMPPSYFPPLPGPHADQCFMAGSFSLTAAGQPRIFTGFPLDRNQPATSTAHNILYRRIGVNLYVVFVLVILNEPIQKV
jgi:hypothetical protein